MTPHLTEGLPPSGSVGAPHSPAVLRALRHPCECFSVTSDASLLKSFQKSNSVGLFILYSEMTCLYSKLQSSSLKGRVCLFEEIA